MVQGPRNISPLKAFDAEAAPNSAERIRQALDPLLPRVLVEIVGSYARDPKIDRAREQLRKSPEPWGGQPMQARVKCAKMLDELEAGVPAWQVREADNRLPEIERGYQYAMSCGIPMRQAFWVILGDIDVAEPTRDALGLLESCRPLGSQVPESKAPDGLLRFDDIDFGEDEAADEPTVSIDGLALPEEMLCDGIGSPWEATDLLKVCAQLRARVPDAKQAGSTIAHHMIAPMRAFARERLRIASGVGLELLDICVAAVEKGSPAKLRDSIARLSKRMNDIAFNDKSQADELVRGPILDARNALVRLLVCIEESGSPDQRGRATGVQGAAASPVRRIG